MIKNFVINKKSKNPIINHDNQMFDILMMIDRDCIFLNTKDLYPLFIAYYNSNYYVFKKLIEVYKINLEI